jgi:hypothetical protein
MAKYSFIDFGNRDFVKYDNGDVVEIEASSFEEAEEWLLTHENETDWSNSGVRYWCWDEEE